MYLYVPNTKSVHNIWLPSQAESSEYRVRLAEQSERLQKAEEQSEQVEKLQRLLESMEMESNNLKDKMAAGEAELLQLKADREDGGEKAQRWRGKRKITRKNSL